MSHERLLDNINFQAVDPKDMYYHVDHFPTLCHDAYQFTKSIEIPASFMGLKKIVFTGMGGSGQTGDIAKSYLIERTDLVVESVHNYILPGWVDDDTLVIANSYSGNTEETLASLEIAHKKNAKLIAISTGGKIADHAKRDGAVFVKFDYKSAPRAAFPYLFIIVATILAKLGHLDLDEKKMTAVVEMLQEYRAKYTATIPFAKNQAKKQAVEIYGKIPVVYASEKLSAVAGRMKAAFNENSKNFAYVEEFPELNHKSLEGLLNPKGMVHMLMLESNFEQKRNLMREHISAEILKKYDTHYDVLKFPVATTWLKEILLFVMFGDFVSYYLAILNHANPGINDIVDYLKEKMA
jgi:glucose/mannose-6-phosphate isomerase